MAEKREFWSGRIGFILATIGSAVGLGSIWKFPYEVGANGGGAFVFFYLAGLALIVFPLMLAEFAVGRHGQSDAAQSIANIAAAAGRSRRWGVVGVLGAVTGFLILSFYSVIGGWVVAYALETVWYGLPGGDPVLVRQRFDALLSAPVRMAAYHAAFMAVTATIVARGIAGGIERSAKILMPVLVALIAMLAIYSVAAGDARAALRFLFAVDPAYLTVQVALQALGLGFFSIGVGLALMITYAAYARADISLRQVAVTTIAGDTAISFLAGFAIFPIVFAENLDPASGPGLVFVTLPIAFAQMPFGLIAAVAFFALLAVAALASAVSVLELVVAVMIRALDWRRPVATALSAGACWAVGLMTVLSFNRLAGWYPLAALPGFAQATWFDLLDHLTSNVMLPAGGFAISVFAGFIVAKRMLAAELGLSPAAVGWLRWLLRYLVPAAIAAIAIGPYLM